MSTRGARRWLIGWEGAPHIVDGKDGDDGVEDGSGDGKDDGDGNMLNNFQASDCFGRNMYW